MSLELAYAPIFKDGDLHAEIVARVGGEPIVRAKVNLSSERPRMRSRKSLLAVDASLSSREIDVELLGIADGVQTERARRLAQTKVEHAPEGPLEPIQWIPEASSGRTRRLCEI